MKTSLKGLMEIAAHEGIVLSPYKDAVGVWTVGIGHTAGAGKPDPARDRREYSIEEVMDIFARDIAKFEARVNRAFDVPLRQHEFDAAVSFDYNTGGIHKASWVRSVNQGNRIAARNQIMNWSKPRAIIPRRRKERNLFFDARYSHGGFVNTYPATKSGQVLWSQGRRVDLRPLMVKHTQASMTPMSIEDVINDGNKPLMESKTVWGAVAGAGASVLSSLSMIPTPVALALIAVAVGAAIFTIWDRRRKAKLARKAAMDV